MIQFFIKNEQVKSFKVENGKVFTTITLGDFNVVNPLLEQFLSTGWEEYIPPKPEPYIPSYAEHVEQYIREHGYPTYGAELAVINNYTQDPATYAEAYAVYMQTRVDAKTWAENQPHRDE